MDSIYCKKQNENGTTFLIKTVKMDDHLAFLILEETGAYLGKATDNYLRETAAYFSVDTDVYISDLKKYVKATFPDVKINITDDRFSINKTVGKLNIIYFSVELEQVNFGKMAMNIATELLNLYAEANQKVAETNDKLLTVQASSDNYRETLENYTKEHNNSESQLYSSFLLVLNEKKRQLQLYKDLLVKTQANQRSRTPTHLLLSDEEISEDCSIEDTNNEDKDYNTDDEKEPAIVNSINNSFDSVGEPLPGPSKTRCMPQSSNKNWKQTKSVDIGKQSNKSVAKFESRSHSDNSINKNNSNDFKVNLKKFSEEFDLSDTEITPPAKLAKRVKPASNKIAVIKNSIKCSEFSQSVKKQESPEVADDSPTLNFNTQDLFDRM